MKRILAIWLPHWPIQRLVSSRPELAGGVVILQGPSRRGQAVEACSPAATRAGVRLGMPVAEAMSLVDRRGPGRLAATLQPHNPLADRHALEQLAQWCHQFAPSAGLEDGEAPQTLWLDATNLAVLYGSEQALVAQVAAALRRRRLSARMAVADAWGAAWAMAHFGPTASHAAAVVPPGESRAVLGSLPVAALRLPDRLLETLGHLGVECLDDLLALPREQLRSRFGPLLAMRMDQALGAAAEVLRSVDPPEQFIVEQALEHSLASHEAVHHALDALLARLAWLLAARNAGALRVACRLVCEGGVKTELTVGLFQPTASARHLQQIAELRLERLRLPAPVAAITVEATAHAPLLERQGVLFDEDRSLGSSRQLAALVDRLAGRLGREAVVRCRLENEAQPELAYREEPLVEPPARPRPRRDARRRLLGPLDRPLHLLNRPAPLQTVSVVPDGPPIHFRRGGRQHQVARHWGPERIETGWWRGRSAARDYYRVETTEGRRFWLYRRRRDGRWFLHGVYE